MRIVRSALAMSCVLLSCAVALRGQTQPIFVAQNQDAFALAVNADGIYVTLRTLTKFDVDGNVLWTTDSTSSLGQFGHTLGPLAGVAGGVYAAARIFVPFGIPYDSGPFIGKFDSNGTLLWRSGGFILDTITDLAADSSGVYAAGVTAGGVLQKYDANDGSFLWTDEVTAPVSSNAPGFVTLTKVAVATHGVYVVGTVLAAVPGMADLVPVAIVRRDDLQGHALWTRAFGAAGNAVPTGVATDATGVYVVGEVSPLGYVPPSQVMGATDVFVRRFDFNGNEEWSRFIQTSSAQVASFCPPTGRVAPTVATNVSGIYVAGETYQNLPGQQSAGATDAFVRKYDFQGDTRWTFQFGTPGCDSVRDIVASDLAGVHILGTETVRFPFPDGHDEDQRTDFVMKLTGPRLH